jgi:molybdopterin converting factor small subunit
MARVRLPRSLVALFPDAPRDLEVPAADLVTLIRALDARYPGMWDRLCEPGPRLRTHINVFVDGHRVTLDAALAEGSVVHIIPAVSGGS